DTERQRTAITSYRSLINALLGDDDHTDPTDRTDRTEHADARPHDRADTHPSDTHPSDARPTDARPTDDGRAADADDVAPGRHALREDEPGATGTADPKGTRNPRTEEHTR